MDIYQIVAVGIVSTVLALTLKKHSPEVSLIISVAASVLIFMLVLPKLAALMDVLKQMSESLGGTLPYITSMIKIIGVAYVAQFGAQLCADSGETSIAGKIELAGKIIIMTISAPILLSLLNLVITILP